MVGHAPDRRPATARFVPLVISVLLWCGLGTCVAQATRADAQNCLTAQTAATTVQDALEGLLSAARETQLDVDDQQKKVDEAADFVDKDKHLIKEVDRLVERGRADSAEATRAADDAIPEIDIGVAKDLADKAIKVGAETEIKELLDLKRLGELGEWALDRSKASVLLRQNRALLKLIGRLKPLGYAEDVLDVAKVGVPVLKLYIALHELEAKAKQYKQTKAELPALEDHLAMLEAELNVFKQIAKTTEDEAEAASANAQNALSAMTAACANQGPSVATAVTYGDPHLTTFDGYSYDFQQVGEFVLVKSNIDAFEIQVRQHPWGGTSKIVAGNEAFAFDVAGDRVGVYASGSGPTTIVNGEPVTLSSTAPEELTNGGSISDSGRLVTISWPDGSSATLQAINQTDLELTVSVPESQSGHLAGLLGNDDGDPSNDLTTSTGTVTPEPPSTMSLWGTFGASWRVTQADSLFDYPPGEGPENFVDATFPEQTIEYSGLTSTQQEQATPICTAAGVTTEPFRSSCIVDVAETGDVTAASSAATAEVAAENSARPPSPTVPTITGARSSNRQASGKRVYFTRFPGAGKVGELLTVKPSVLQMSGDASWIINGLRWSSWGGATAHGTGVSSVETCNPNCVSGGIRTTNSRVTSRSS